MSFCVVLGMGRARLWRGRRRRARKNTRRGGKVGACTRERVPALEPGRPRRITLTCHADVSHACTARFTLSLLEMGAQVPAGNFQWEKPSFLSAPLYACMRSSPPPCLSLLLLLKADGWMCWRAWPPAHPAPSQHPPSPPTPRALVPAPRGTRHLLLRLMPNLSIWPICRPRSLQQRGATLRVCAKQPKQGISLQFAGGFILARLAKTGTDLHPPTSPAQGLKPAPPAGDGHPVKPPTRPGPVQTFYFPSARAAQPAWGWVCPLEAKLGGPPRPPSPPSSWPSAVAPPGMGRAAVAGTTPQTPPSFTLSRAAKKRQQKVYPKMDTTPPHPLPNPVPQIQICCTGESDTEQHKTCGDGDESPPAPLRHGPPETAQRWGAAGTHGESLKTQGWGVAGNKLICTDVLGGRGDGRDRRRRAVPPKCRGVPMGHQGVMNHMPVQIKPRNDARSQVMENGGEMGRCLGSHRARLWEQREGRGPLRAEGLCRGEPRGSPLDQETPGLAPCFQGSAVSQGTRRPAAARSCHRLQPRRLSCSRHRAGMPSPGRRHPGSSHLLPELGCATAARGRETSPRPLLSPTSDTRHRHRGQPPQRHQ